MKLKEVFALTFRASFISELFQISLAIKNITITEVVVDVLVSMRIRILNSINSIVKKTFTIFVTCIVYSGLFEIFPQILLYHFLVISVWSTVATKFCPCFCVFKLNSRAGSNKSSERSLKSKLKLCFRRLSFPARVALSVFWIYLRWCYPYVDHKTHICHWNCFKQLLIILWAIHLVSTSSINFGIFRYIYFF